MFKQIGNTIFRIVKWVGLIGSFCIAINMLFIVVNVILRAIFRIPIAGYTDIIGMISCIITSLTISYTEFENGHIKVDFFMNYFSKNVQNIFYVFTGILNFAVVGTLAVCFWNYANRSYIERTVSVSANLPYTPFLLISAFGMLLFALTIIAKIIFRLSSCGRGMKNE